MGRMEVRGRCGICRRPVQADKFHPYQRICARVECRRVRQQQRGAAWRKRNPSYWKGWGRDTREAARRWRSRHPGYYRRYRTRPKRGAA